MGSYGTVSSSVSSLGFLGIIPGSVVLPQKRIKRVRNVDRMYIIGITILAALLGNEGKLYVIMRMELISS